MDVSKILKLQVFFILLLIIFTSCSSGPEPINYGEENCAFCKMLIMDKRFGAETVTKKGKIYKFDAVECMIGFTKEGSVPENEVAGYYVADAAGKNENQLLPVTEAGFMQSEKLPSPMGSNISAFAKNETYKNALQEFEGQPLSWEEVKEKVGK